jgi:hypothetical protein
MRELKIVFTKSKKKFAICSKAIMWWTKKPYSHCARAVQIRDWGYRFYHASEGKVNYEFEKFFHQKHEIVKEYKLMIDDEMDKKIKYECYLEAGNKYGMMQNLGIFLVDIGLKKDTPWKSGRNCSELIYLEVFKEMLPELDFNPDTIKPHQIEEIILEYFEEKDGSWTLKP